MGLFLIFISILILGILLVCLGKYGDNYSTYYFGNKGFKYFLSDHCDAIIIIGSILICCAIIALCVAGITAGVRSNNTELNIQYAEEYDMLMSKMDTDKDTLAYKLQVEKYNARIDKANQDIKNPWINWYADRSVLNLPKIKLK